LAQVLSLSGQVAKISSRSVQRILQVATIKPHRCAYWKQPIDPHFEAMVSGTREHAETLRGKVQAALNPLGLRLSEAKTRVVHLDEGFDFLGFRIQRRRKRGTNKRLVYTYPSKRAFETVKRKVRELTRRSSTTLWKLLPRINAVVRGWCNYFRHGTAKATFSALSAFIWHRVARWIWKQHNRPSWKVLRRRIMPGWVISAGKVSLFEAASTPVTRYRYRGQHILTPWAEQTFHQRTSDELVESRVR
jgi:RNA-directed DNA polymerase